VITAHHVISAQMELDVHIPDPCSGGILYPPMRVEQNCWKQPLANVDLAIAPLPCELTGSDKYHAFPVEYMFPTGRVQSMHLGTHVWYLGYLSH